MTPFFSASTSAVLAGRAVTLAILVRLDFPAGVGRYWLGHGQVEIAGERWLGTGALVSLSGLQRSLNDAAVPLSFTLSGVDETMRAVAVEQGNSIRGRPAWVYLQFFAQDGAPLDSPVCIWAGSMDRLRYSGEVANEHLTLICEGLFTSRSRAAFSLMTDINQQRRSPGDRFFEHAAGVVEKRIKWP